MTEKMISPKLKRCAVLSEKNQVINILLVDAEQPHELPDGIKTVDVQDDVQIGFLYADGQFTDPNPPAAPVLVSLANLQVTAQASIDGYFDKLYQSSVANAAIGAEYDAAYLMADRWLKNPTTPAPERVKALAETFGVSNAQAAGVVVERWLQAQAVAFDKRGAARLRAKLAIRQAKDPDGVTAAESAGRAAMEAIVFVV